MILQHEDAYPAIKVDSEISEIFRDLSKQDDRELMMDIQAHGVRVPLEVAQDGTIVDGHRRYHICQDLGIDPPVNIRSYDSRDEMIETAVALNLYRRHLNALQRAEIALKYLLPREREKARLRQNTSTGGVHLQVRSNLNEAGRGRAYAVAAKKVGLSEGTLRKAEVVFNHAPGAEVERFKKEKGKVSIDKLLRARAGEGIEECRGVREGCVGAR